MKIRSLYAAIPVGKVAAIPIRIHLSFVLVVVWIAWQGWNEGGWRAGVWATVLIVLLFGCVVLHELGHSLVAMAFGAKVRSVTLYPIGGVAGLESVPRQPIRELLMALAGPAVNAVIVVALCLWKGGFPEWAEASAFPTNAGELLDALIRANAVLGIFNLLPAFPMDGGRVLRSLLALVVDYPRATSLAAALGQALAIGLLLLGMAVANPFLAIIGVFVFWGAGSEEQQARLQTHMQGLSVRDVCRCPIICLAPEDPAGRCAELEMQSGQRHFPVAWQGRVVGLLPHSLWTQVLKERGPQVPVREFMQKVFVSVDANAPLERVYRDLIGPSGGVLPVVENGLLVGLLTVEAVMQYLDRTKPPSVYHFRDHQQTVRDRFTVDLG